MSEQDQSQERIETHGNQRFKFIGQHIVAVEQKCFHCHQTYWSPIISVAPGPSMVSRAHQCPPDRQAGASVIDKFG